jgi:hypothetical protein
MSINRALGCPPPGTNRQITRAERERIIHHSPYVTIRCHVGADLMGNVIILSKHKNPLPVSDEIKDKLVLSLRRFWDGK